MLKTMETGKTLGQNILGSERHARCSKLQAVRKLSKIWTLATPFLVKNKKINKITYFLFGTVIQDLTRLIECYLNMRKL